MNSWDWVILFVIVAWIVYRSKSTLLPEKVSFLYYTNIKPALYKFGFEGSSGDVTEEMSWIESLYYLEDLKLALEQTGFKDLEMNDADTFGVQSFHVNNGELANIYTISFSTLLARGKNKGVLELSVKNEYREKELGKFGTYITKYCAPIHHFNSANLRQMLWGFFYDIKRFHESPNLKRKFYVHGVKLSPQDNTYMGGWMPLIYPDGEETSEKSKKAAYKIMAKGYDNSIVCSS